MGQKQGRSKYEDDYEDENEDEEKYTNKKSNDTPEDIEGKYKEIKEELNNLQLPYEQLKKVNEIINNIKVANLYEETTFNVLKQIVDEESMKILPPDYSEQYKTVKQVMLLNAPLKPIYAKLNKWEDLFNLELPDDIIDKLNIYAKEKKKQTLEQSLLQPKVEEVAKIYSEWKGEQCDMINTQNCLEYEREYKAELSRI